jgi:hypothetical protein
MINRFIKLPSTTYGDGWYMSLISIVGLCTSDRLRMLDRFTKLTSRSSGGGW